MSEPGEVAQGEVVAFDDEVGLGEVASDGHRWRFHCTTITDGTRTIAEGTLVSFRLVPARHGAWEAADIRPL